MYTNLLSIYPLKESSIKIRIKTADVLYYPPLFHISLKESSIKIRIKTEVNSKPTIEKIEL